MAAPRLVEASDEPHVIMIIRHAEKPLPSNNARGITSGGRYDKRSLTVTGWQRAGALVELFAPARGAPPAGLWRPDSIYSSAAERGRSKRSIQTVEPLADRIGVEIVDRFAAGDEVRLVAELTARPGATVVSWHHNSICRIIKHLGEVTPSPPRQWPHDRFDMVWTFTRSGRGWRFTQVPQLLLPGDQLEPIAS